MELINYIGRVFGHLTVVGEGDKKHGNRTWNCLCVCGKTFNAYHSHLQQERTKSCGCMRHANKSNFGETNTRLYRCWVDMKSRAKSRSDCVVCPEWKNYQTFKEWSLLNGYTDDKVMCRNNDVGDYKPNNVRWDTQESNAVEAHAKYWLVTDPHGIEYKVHNLAKFCRDSSQHPSKLYDGLRGLLRSERESYKGWKCQTLTHIQAQ